MGIAADAYARMLRQLLPPGPLWDPSTDSLLAKLLRGAADELERVDMRAEILEQEADPRTATELLSDFEADLDLAPDGTVAERRARVVALLTARQRSRPVDIQNALAILLGQDAADVVVMERTRAFAISVGDDRAIYQFHVYRDPTLPGTYDIEAAQKLLDKIAHSHTQGRVIESISFRCNDPYSLTDRDLLGV